MIFEHQVLQKKIQLVQHSLCNMTSSALSLDIRNAIISLLSKTLTKVIWAFILARSEHHLLQIQSNLVQFSKFFDLLEDYENI